MFETLMDDQLQLLVDLVRYRRSVASSSWHVSIPTQPERLGGPLWLLSVVLCHRVQDSVSFRNVVRRHLQPITVLKVLAPAPSFGGLVSRLVARGLLTGRRRRPGPRLLRAAAAAAVGRHGVEDARMRIVMGS